MVSGVRGAGADARRHNHCRGFRCRRRTAAATGRSQVHFIDTPIDLKPLYDEHAVVVVPLFEGSGTRGKILEALGHERFVVTTPKGVEGLDLREEGEGVVITQSAEAMAARIDGRSPRLRIGRPQPRRGQKP